MAEPGDDGWAAIGEATRAGTVTVTPVEIVEDSRCPEGVQCVWAGRVVVRTLVEGDRSRFVDMVLGEEIREADGLLELDRVEPRAAEGAEMSPDEYRLHYRFAPFIMDAN